MGIFSRLADIVDSNLNAMLDRAEDPEKLIRLVIQEMEDTLVEVRTTAARTIAERKDVHRRLARLTEAQGEWERKASLALGRGREDLAKAALVEKARLADMAKAMEDELAQLDEALARHDEDVALLDAKLSEARARQKAMTARQTTVDQRVKVRRKLADPRIDDAFARFEQLERRIDRAEGEAEAYDLGRRKSLAEEIAELEAEQSIEAELAALKARMSGGGAA
ncbi:MAG: phage shock protein PspA [Alphaproteobacteria bacterium]